MKQGKSRKRLATWALESTCFLWSVCVLWVCLFTAFAIEAANQTPDVTPVITDDSLPFSIRIEKSKLRLPNGLHSYAYAVYEDKWLLIAGRTNGLHGFEDSPGNFPPMAQNRVVYVVDPCNGKICSRALDSHGSGLSFQQVDELSVTSPQFFQRGATLYLAGGYGVNTETNSFSTKNALTAIDLPGMMRWVCCKEGAACDYIRQTHHCLLRVTGGYMTAVDDDLSMLLIMGQNFQGAYLPDSNGEYTQQVRRFKIIDDGCCLRIKPQKMQEPDPSYRRRDLNVIPFIRCDYPLYVAFSGVFTETGGAWTVPVEIRPEGWTYMASPNGSTTFKQAMNNYASANFGLYSQRTKKMYALLLGGITFGFFQDGIFQTDDELPFTNQVTAIQNDRFGVYKQYLMCAEYPVILSQGSNPGNRLLFGAAAQFISAADLPSYPNGVIALDNLESNCPTFLGYVVGGIMSTLPNTNTQSDSTASPFIFKVFLEWK